MANQYYSQANLLELFELIGSIDGNEYAEFEEFKAICCPESIWPNQLVEFDPRADQLETAVDELERTVTENDLLNLLMLDAFAKLEVVSKLSGRGYKRGQWTAMSTDLRSYALHESESDLQIDVVENEEQLTQWIRVAERALMGGHPLKENIFTELLNDDRAELYLGSIKGEPMATAFIFESSDSVGIYFVSVDESHRGRGYRAGLTLRFLNEAK
ncbi:MAG: GNAT family N-acetyltransferase [Flavobacteriales bacterium]|nr:GNAT family N-acetyltransferase [Flavobacteriales bacterium]